MEPLSSIPPAPPPGWVVQRLPPRPGRLRRLLYRLLWPCHCARCGELYAKLLPADLSQEVWRLHRDAGTEWVLVAHGYRCPTGCDGAGRVVLL